MEMYVKAVLGTPITVEAKGSRVIGVDEEKRGKKRHLESAGDPGPNKVTVRIPYWGNYIKSTRLPQTVLSLKEEVENGYGIPAKSTKLLYNEMELPNEKCLRDCIPSESEVQLRLEYVTKVTVRIPYDGAYETTATSSMTVADFKVRLQNRTGIAASRLHLFFMWWPLEDSKPLFHNIPYQPQITMSLEYTTAVTVALPHGRIFRYSLSSIICVRDFKKKLEKRRGIFVNRINLFYQNRRLKDDYSIRLTVTRLFWPSRRRWTRRQYIVDCIPHDPEPVELRLEVGCAGGRPTNVTVHLRYGGNYEGWVCCTTTVQAFKEEMDHKTGIPTSRVKLFYKGKELENRKYILDCIPHLPVVELRLELVD